MTQSLHGALIAPFEAFGFMRLALVACLALALANGPVGTFLLARRMSLAGDVLSHAVMPGAALGFLYAGTSLAASSIGGLLTGLLVAVLAGLAAGAGPVRQDVGLVAFYLASLALGVLIVALKGGNADVMHVLFGTVLAVDLKALLFIACACTATLLVLAAIYRPLAVESFDPAFLRAVGGGGGGYRATFVFLVVLTLVASFQAFGTLLAIGPMLLPAAAARRWTQRLWPAMVLSSGIGMACCFAGLMISYYRNVPSGPAIVLCAAAVYALSLIATRAWHGPQP